MQPEHVSPKYITSCPSCYETCSEIHPSNLLHHTVGTHSLETQIESILNQNYDQWISIFENLQIKIQSLIQEVTQYLQRLDQTVNEYRNILILNQQEQSKEDQSIISKAMGKLSLFKYNDLSCNEIYRIIQALKDKDQKRELNLSDQLLKMEDKVLFDLHEIVSMKFSCLQYKFTEQNTETQNKKRQNNEKVKMDIEKEIDCTQISKKIQEIMKVEIQKIKPLINEQISKAKTNIVSNQQIQKIDPDNKEDQSQKKTHKTDNWNKIYGSFKETYCGYQQEPEKYCPSKLYREKQQITEKQQYSRHYRTSYQVSEKQKSFDEQSYWNEKDYSQYSYQKTQSFRRPQNYKSQTQSKANTQKQKIQLKISNISQSHKKYGKFNFVVKVLVIIQKQMKFGGKICTRFLAGDKTGAALFMAQNSPLLEPGNNIFIQQLMWANFNHEKQGNYTKNTIISIDENPIKHIGSFRMGETATNLFNENAKQIQVLISKEQAKLNKMKKEVQKKYVPKQSKMEKEAQKQYVPKQSKMEKEAQKQYAPKQGPEESKKAPGIQEKNNNNTKKPVPAPVNPQAQRSANKNQNTNQQTSQKSQPPTFKKFKIEQIKLNQTGCWITGQVLKVILNDGKKKRFILGDETGLVNCEIDYVDNQQVKQGSLVYLQSFNVTLEDGSILMRKSVKGRIIVWNEAPSSINRKNKISQKKYS